MTTLHKLRAKLSSAQEIHGLEWADLLPQASFAKVLQVEQKRTERSRNPFLLMLLDLGQALAGPDKRSTLDKILSVLSQGTRETDLIGWYKEGTVVGIVFTEIPTEEVGATAEIIVTKIRSLLSTCLSAERASVIRLTMQAFPEDWGADGSGGASGKAGPIEEIPRSSDKKVQQLVKRGLDIVGSAVALALSLPLLIAIAIVIKCTSKGPILFRQMRVGQYGQKFMFLKFRSMHTKNDSAIHQEFVKQLITRKADPKTTQDKSAGAAQAGVYKLTADPRITPIGRLLRRTSLDELPQFLNVLLGEMSLVGPRPPIPYEVACYDIWHRRRLLAVKPGITGLWQVCGRSRTTFDEMVRLDLKYARTWSVWMDIQILLRTPRAMMSGEGAY